MSDDLKKGVSYAFAASLISGFSIFLNKYALTAVQSPIVLTTSKNLIVGVILLAFLVIFGKWDKIKRLSKSDLFKLIIIATIGGSVPFYLFFTGLSSTEASTAAVIQKSLVLWVAVLAIPILKEKISLLGVVAVMIIFLGNTYIGGIKPISFSQGEMMILAATLFWAVESIVVKKVLSSLDPDILVTGRMAMGSLILLFISAIASPSVISDMTSLTSTQSYWIMGTALLLFGYVVSWYRALSLAPATLVTAILVFATIITNILSAVFVTNVWSLGSAIQSLLICVGIMLTYVGYKVAKSKEIIIGNKVEVSDA